MGWTSAKRPSLADGAGMIAVILLIFAALHVPGVDVAPASTALNLYQARTIVTGQREETRGPGLERCLEDVLVKVSGDPLVLADPAIAGMKAHAASYVAGFRYRDRMEGIMPVELPTMVDLGVAGLTFETLPLTQLADLDVAAKKFGGDLALAGSLVW